MRFRRLGVEIPAVLLPLAADTTTDDEQVGGEEPIEVLEVGVHPHRPLLPRQLLFLLHPSGAPVLDRVVAVELEVAELGVGDQGSIHEHPRPDPGSEGEHHHHALAVATRPEVDLGDGGGIGVVEHRERQTQPLLEE